MWTIYHALQTSLVASEVSLYHLGCCHLTSRNHYTYSDSEPIRTFHQPGQKKCDVWTNYPNLTKETRFGGTFAIIFTVPSHAKGLGKTISSASLKIFVAVVVPCVPGMSLSRHFTTDAMVASGKRTGWYGKCPIIYTVLHPPRGAKELFYHAVCPILRINFHTHSWPEGYSNLLENQKIDFI